MKKNQLRVEILGTSFSIQSEEKPEYLKAVCDYLKGKINDARQNTKVSDPLKLAILACLNCIDDLFREKERSYRLAKERSEKKVSADERIISEEIDEITARILERIDNSIGGG